MKKIAVGILGATGSVGQKFIQLLADHPYFEVTEVAASDRSAGKNYAQTVNWFLETSVPEKVAKLEIKPCQPNLNCRTVFSALDSSVAGEIESEFARAGYTVISNSKNHRMDKEVPLLIPEVNADHLALLNGSRSYAGKIVNNPNCSVIGLVLALKPLHDAFGLEQVNVTTLQALSGAGFPGIASLSIVENVIPYIGGNEEEKIEEEPLKILGTLVKNSIHKADFVVSAQCNRVPVLDGHLETVQVKLKQKTKPDAIIECWKNFKAEPQNLDLPMAPRQPIHYFERIDYPQPRLHRNIDKGMAVSVGRLRPCSIFDYKFVMLSHNTIRGAAGGTILIAELMKAKGLLS
jgi:aspartate-semialdehyde dehydrogenase